MDRLGTAPRPEAAKKTTGGSTETKPSPTFDQIVELLSPNNFDPSPLKKGTRITFAQAKGIFDEQILPKYQQLNGFPKLQLDYIGNYFASMLTEGNTIAFSMAVCLAMGVLYKQGLEGLLPAEIEANTILNSGTEMRKKAVESLARVMANNGGNYAIIQDYLFNQQEVGSWSNSSKALKYFLYSQICEKSKTACIGERGRFFFGEFSPEQFQNPYFEKTGKFREDQYIKSMVFYKAFTAIGLGKLRNVTYNGNQDFLSTTPEGKRYISVVRAVGTSTMEGYKGPGLFDADESMFTSGIPNGIADSASLGDPPDAWVRNSKYETHIMQVPICNFFAAYFLSPELCREGLAATQNMVTHPNLKYTPEKAEEISKSLRFQRELICDMSTSSPIKVVPYQDPTPLPARQAQSTSGTVDKGKK
jgi:hypothetical protein